ncbi:MAG: hypothetical protein ACK5N0_07355 [Synechococcaceae cyanobacterium]
MHTPLGTTGGTPKPAAIDAQHSTRDGGIARGQAEAQARGKRRDIQRFGHVLAPLVTP